MIMNARPETPPRRSQVDNNQAMRLRAFDIFNYAIAALSAFSEWRQRNSDPHAQQRAMPRVIPWSPQATLAAKIDMLIRAQDYDGIREVVRQTLPEDALTDPQIDKLADALSARAEAAALAERPRQRRREWTLLIIGLIAGALLSIPIGIWVNSIS